MDYVTIVNYIANSWVYDLLFLGGMIGMCVTSILTARTKQIIKRAIGYTGTALFWGLWIFLYCIYPVGI